MAAIMIMIIVLRLRGKWIMWIMIAVLVLSH